MSTFAIGGLTTSAALAIPHPTGVYDWTIFSFGANDAAPWKGVSVPDFAENLERLVARSESARVVLGPAPVAKSTEATGRTNALIHEYSRAAAIVAGKLAATFVPMVELLGESDLAEDGVHLNDEAYSKIIDALMPVIAGG